MRTETKEVKSKSQTVGHAEYPVYETLEEARESLGETTALDLLNAQVRTNKLNEVRAAAVQKPSKKYLMEQAWLRVTPEEFSQVAGDKARQQELLNQKMKEVEEEILANAPSQDNDEDQDED